MRPIDTSAPMPVPSGNAPREHDSQANQFGDSLRAAARANPASPRMPSPTGKPPGTTAASTPSSRSDDSSPPHEARAATPPAQSAQQRPVAGPDQRDARPRAHATSSDHAAHRSAHRHAETPQPPEGIALQTLLAAAHPLLTGTGDGDGAAAASPPPSALTPQDVAASVTQAWLREPATQDVAGVDSSARWTFTLGDPLTPLAALHISGDPTAGWGLQLTAGNGLPARELAAHTERLRRRLRARGQAVDRLEVDDDPQR